MDRQYKSFKNQGVQTLAVNIAQTDFEVQNFVDRYDLTFPVVIDKTKSVMTATMLDNYQQLFLLIQMVG